VAADLEAVNIFAQVIGVVNGPTRQPKDLAFQFAQNRQIIRGHLHRSL
jgi:hypothetical protein